MEKKSGTYLLTVQKADSKQRTDRFLKRKFANLPQSMIEKSIRKGLIRVNNKRVKSSFILEEEHIVKIPKFINDLFTYSGEDQGRNKTSRKNTSGGAIDAEMVRKLVIYQEEHLIAINKPPSLATQGGKNISISLDDMIAAICADGDEKPKLVHRLDQDTSGVLLLAKNRRAAALLGEMFQQKKIIKIYWAAVCGSLKDKTQIIETPFSKEKGCFQADQHIGTDGSREEYYPGKDKNTKFARTLCSHIASSKHGISWVALYPITGRKHQIRQHLWQAGSPVLFDKKYGKEFLYDPKVFLDGKVGNMHLHSRTIIFEHPFYKGKMLKITADLPEHMQSLWQECGWSYDDFDNERFLEECNNIQII